MYLSFIQVQATSDIQDSKARSVRECVLVVQVGSTVKKTVSGNRFWKTDESEFISKIIFILC